VPEIMSVVKYHLYQEKRSRDYSLCLSPLGSNTEYQTTPKPTTTTVSFLHNILALLKAELESRITTSTTTTTTTTTTTPAPPPTTTALWEYVLHVLQLALDMRTATTPLPPETNQLPTFEYTTNETAWFDQDVYNSTLMPELSTPVEFDVGLGIEITTQQTTVEPPATTTASVEMVNSTATVASTSDIIDQTIATQAFVKTEDFINEAANFSKQQKVEGIPISIIPVESIQVNKNSSINVPLHTSDLDLNSTLEPSSQQTIEQNATLNLLSATNDIPTSNDIIMNETNNNSTFSDSTITVTESNSSGVANLMSVETHLLPTSDGNISAGGLNDGFYNASYDISGNNTDTNEYVADSEILYHSIMFGDANITADNSSDASQTFNASVEGSNIFQTTTLSNENMTTVLIDNNENGNNFTQSENVSSVVWNSNQTEVNNTNTMATYLNTYETRNLTEAEKSQIMTSEFFTSVKAPKTSTELGVLQSPSISDNVATAPTYTQTARQTSRLSQGSEGGLFSYGNIFGLYTTQPPLNSWLGFGMPTTTDPYDWGAVPTTTSEPVEDLLTRLRALHARTESSLGLIPSATTDAFASKQDITTTSLPDITTTVVPSRVPSTGVTDENVTNDAINATIDNVIIDLNETTIFFVNDTHQISNFGNDSLSGVDLSNKSNQPFVNVSQVDFELNLSNNQTLELTNTEETNTTNGTLLSVDNTIMNEITITSTILPSWNDNVNESGVSLNGNIDNATNLTVIDVIELDPTVNTNSTFMSINQTSELEMNTTAIVLEDTTVANQNISIENPQINSTHSSEHSDITIDTKNATTTAQTIETLETTTTSMPSTSTARITIPPQPPRDESIISRWWYSIFTTTPKPTTTTPLTPPITDPLQVS